MGVLVGKGVRVGGILVGEGTGDFVAVGNEVLVGIAMEVLLGTGTTGLLGWAVTVNMLEILEGVADGVRDAVAVKGIVGVKVRVNEGVNDGKAVVVSVDVGAIVGVKKSLANAS